jgi:hypothetical protein
MTRSRPWMERGFVDGSLLIMAVVKVTFLLNNYDDRIAEQ